MFVQSDTDTQSLEWAKTGSPEPGASLITKVERVGIQLRPFVDEVAAWVKPAGQELVHSWAPRQSGLGFSAGTGGTLSRRLAWLLVAQWLTAVAQGAVAADSSLQEAEDWFVGDAAPSSWTFAPALRPAASVGELDRATVGALLPYLLDPLSPATRKDVLAGRGNGQDRSKRKAEGIYYTPADVSLAMVKACLVGGRPRVLDPACGTGVFLKAARCLNPDVRVFGVDLSQVAVEMCAFVLLAAEADPDPASSPWHRWHAIRCRLAVADSLLLDRGEGSDSRRRERAAQHAELLAQLSEGVDPGPNPDQHVSSDLEVVFPELDDGADLVISNPPYAALGARSDLGALSRRFACFAARPATAPSNTFLPFVEQTWRLLAPHGTGSTVVPLSVTYGSSTQLRALRAAMEAQFGAWEVLSFDRAPDALFGDDVKTRASILRFRAGLPKGLVTTGVIRWTSRTRGSVLARPKMTAVPEPQFDRCLPKLGSVPEAALYAALRSVGRRLIDGPVTVSRRAATLDTWEQPCVLVGGTAYNWLGLELPIQGEPPVGAAPAPRACVETISEVEAQAVYALLSSRVIYWLWRTEGDAFHVPTGFLANLPFDISAISANALADLAALGSAAWAVARATPIISVNKGRTTVAFSPYRDADLLDRIDEAVGVAWGLAPEISGADLRGWYSDVLVVDAADPTRAARHVP